MARKTPERRCRSLWRVHEEVPGTPERHGRFTSGAKTSGAKTSGAKPKSCNAMVAPLSFMTFRA
jgi:hypothetical protein